MGTEYVVAFRDDQGRDLRIDLNNGYVYDKSGAQIERWEPKDSTAEEHELQQLTAEHVHDLSMGRMRSALGSPAQAMSEFAQTLRLRAEGKDVVHTMDLGTADVHLPAAMPNFAGGYKNEPPMADVIAPPVLSAKPADKYFIFDKEDAYQEAMPTAGAPAGQVDEIPPRLSNFTFTTAEYALGSFVASQIDAAADAPLRVRQAAAKRVLNALLIRRERRVANLLTTSGNWNAGNVATIAAGSQWNGGANSDPIKDIHTRMEASFGGVSGMIMPEPIFHAFQRNPNVQKYFTYKDSSKALPNAKELQTILELPPIYVAKMKYQTSSTALSYIWGTSVVLFRMPDQMPPTTQDDVATAYTFRWDARNVPDATSGYGYGSSGGFVVREFFNQFRGSMGGSQIVVVHHDAETITSKYIGGLLLSVTQ